MRTYKRKTNQQAWAEDAMKSAVTAVRSGILSQNKAAKQFGIPVATLNRRVKSGKNDEDASKKKLGRFTTVFNAEQENALVKHLLQMEERFFGLNYIELRTLAFQFATMNNLPNNFNKKTGMAGKDWLYLFLKRHPMLSVRTPENTSAARASGFNKVSVEKFFSLLGSLLDKYNFTASRIYNCDETAISTVPNKPIKIISLKGKKQIGGFSSAERGTLVTVEICFNATGHYIPPLLVIPRVRRNSIYEVGLPAESIVAFHKSGWMQSDIFCNIWFEHFVKHTHPTEENPILLILDGHATHVKNLELINKARENHVHILAIPPHTSHRLQPLDVAFMYPLSNFYAQELKNWQRNKPNKIIELSDVGQIFGKAYSRAATLSNAESGFKKTGIYPYDPHVFSDIDFAASVLTEREQLTDQQSNLNLPSTSSDENLLKTPARTEGKTVNILSHVLLAPSTSSCARDKEIREKTPPKAQIVYPTDILPLPTVIPKETNRGLRQRGKTAIITSSPYLDELKQNKIKIKAPIQVKRNLVSQIKVPKKKVKLGDSSSDSDDTAIEDLCEESSDNSNFISDENETSLEHQQQTFTIVQKEISLKDFVLVVLKEIKTQTQKQFVGQVIRRFEDNSLEMSFEIKFMRNYRMHKDIFIFPEVDDVSVIYKNEIEGVLTKVTFLRYGKVKFE